MENSFANLISPAKDILILLPNKPYLDQVAAGLSLSLSLKESKNVNINCSNPMTVEFSRLVGVDNVSRDLGSKNLVIKLINYNHEQIDKVAYDIENNEFKLTIAPKSGFKAPDKSQLDVSQSGVSADLIILVGGANEDHFPALSSPDLNNQNIIHVGTRLLEVSSDLKILSFARPASSTSEIVASLIKESGLTFDADIATNLLAGIEDQSKNFQSNEVTADTFMIFAELIKMGGRRMLKSRQVKYPQGAIPNTPYTQRVQSQLDEDIPFPEEEPKDIPSTWSEPKIYTGTSVS